MVSNSKGTSTREALRRIEEGKESLALEETSTRPLKTDPTTQTMLAMVKACISREGLSLTALKARETAREETREATRHPSQQRVELLKVALTGKENPSGTTQTSTEDFQWAPSTKVSTILAPKISVLDILATMVTMAIKATMATMATEEATSRIVDQISNRWEVNTIHTNPRPTPTLERGLARDSTTMAVE